MTPTAYLTTSWDDGHPLDARLAAMLTHHNLPGTFYIPRHSGRETMGPAQVRDLSSSFEVGAHTLTHLNLNRATGLDAAREIDGSKAWVEDMTGRPCAVFCPPEGKYARRHLDAAREAGFLGVRTVELVSLDPPRVAAGLSVLPTSVQACPHGRLVFLKNFAKRGAYRNLWLYARHGRSPGWVDLAGALAGVVAERGGVFHLWGHSWEIEETQQWDNLERVFRMLGAFRDRLAPVTNGRLARSALDDALAATGRAEPVARS